MSKLPAIQNVELVPVKDEIEVHALLIERKRSHPHYSALAKHPTSARSRRAVPIP